MDGLVIHGENSIAPNIYLNDFFQQYEKGEALENIMREIAGSYLAHYEDTVSLGRSVFEYDKIKGDLIVCVCNAEMNAELLRTMPHEIQEDLALVYRVKREKPDGDTESVLVTNSLLNHWGIGEQKLKEDAWNSMKTKGAPCFCSMEDILWGILEEAPAEITVSDSPIPQLYVLTNDRQMWGAAYMFDRETMSDIAEALESSLIVFPSSIHEVLILQEQKDMDVEAMQEMVQTVNATEVEAQEVLSNHVYRYDREEQTLSIMSPSEQTQGMSMNL